MDSDDESFDDFNDSQEMEVEVCVKKNSSFQALTTTDIENLMNQYIDDVKSIVQVSCCWLVWFCFFLVVSFDWISEHGNPISMRKNLDLNIDSCHAPPFAFCWATQNGINTSSCRKSPMKIKKVVLHFLLRQMSLILWPKRRWHANPQRKKSNVPFVYRNLYKRYGFFLHA